jgi:tRNA (guanine37-N1)-methyltransferase
MRSSSVRIDVVTLLPDMFGTLDADGVVGRALRGGIASLHLWPLREFAPGRHRQVDDRPYGGGPGMVLMPGPVVDAVRGACGADPRPAAVSYLSPQGRMLTQAGVREIAARERLVLLCGRYEGIDERAVQLVVDEEWSIGDYVLSGGELAAMVLIDAVVRCLPGALGDAESAAQDSFEDGLLDHPHYTRPECYAGRAVPAVLRSGDHGAVARWRRAQALARTRARRPDLLRGESGAR